MYVNEHTITLPHHDALDAMRDDKGNLHLATVTPASPEAVAKVLRADEKGCDGRSNWVWLRLADGTLALAIFPQGDLYEDLIEGEKIA